MSFFKFSLSSFFLVLIISVSHADEGMWLPIQIQKIAEQKMKDLGLLLSADDIYNEERASIKDAIVMLNGGMCSAEIVSSQGLVLTNHHCAYRAIQSHSSVESDYLTDGFWAKSKNDELINKGMTASIVVRMEDVTKRIMSKIDTVEDASKKSELIEKEIDAIVEEAIDSTEYNAEVKSMYFGSEYYLYVYETFKDVRLVGAPPSSIGKFGGDTDNWMWTRHTGDFAMLRIYADSLGKPAEYSEDNVPYQPKHHLPISVAPKKENDFAMILGFPGSTERYLPSDGVELYVNKMHPERVKVRRKKLDIIQEHMNEDEEVRIKYASKYASVSNYWKYFIGQRKGLKRLDVQSDKEEQEQEFSNWIDQREDSGHYSGVLPLIEGAYSNLDSTSLSNVYINEAAFGIELFKAVYDYARLGKSETKYKKRMDLFYKDYDPGTDEDVMAKMLEMYINGVPKSQIPTFLLQLDKKYKGDFEKYAEKVFKKSIFASKEKLEAFLASPSDARLKKDPAYKGFYGILGYYQQHIQPSRNDAFNSLEEGQKLFVQAQREMNPDKTYYPDANSTLRLTYGSVKSYSPGDAKLYHYQSTAMGILEKEDADNPEFVVPDKLIELIENKNFGRYADNNNELPVNFLTTNDITGGNSGSGVLNSKGELIGIAFDGNWEAMSGDIAFASDLQRTISVDIRYVLFIIDKYAGATHLIEEMEIR